MIVRLARHLLILLTMLAASFYLPEFYWQLFYKKPIATRITHSIIQDDFLITRTDTQGTTTYWTTQGQSLTRREYIQNNPFLFYSQLQRWGIAPDSVKGYPMRDFSNRIHTMSLRFDPRETAIAQIPLYPLLESAGEYITLSFPDDFFRIRQRLEFISPVDRSIVDSLTIRFSDALDAAGFQYPAQSIYGNPTTHKIFDEGYYVVDQAGRLWHLKKVDGKPFIQLIELPAGCQVQSLQVIEHPIRQIRAALLTRERDYYFILWDDYRPVRLPLDRAPGRPGTVSIYLDPFGCQLLHNRENSTTCYLLDRDYRLLKSHTETWTPRHETLAGRVYGALFPYSCQIRSADDRYIHLTLRLNGWPALIGIAVALLATLLARRYYPALRRSPIAELGWVAVGGLYGFIALLLIPPDPED